MLQGKGFFIWKIPSCEKGSPESIAREAKSAGFSHVLIKIANGTLPYNIDDRTRTDLVLPVVNALRAQGIQPWGWHYVYGYDPAGEARIAVQRLQQLKLDGYVIDAEIEYTLPGRATAARRYMKDLRSALPDLPMALSSYRFPKYHPNLPWREFLESCDLNMPQVYWEKAHNPSAQLARVVREFQAMTPNRPVIPTGPAYKWDGWRPTDADIEEFFDASRKYEFPAVNFFSWDHCRRDLPNLWEIIAKQNYVGEPAPENVDIPEQYVQALNQRKPDQIAALYRNDAVQVTSARTIQGHTALRAWFQYFLIDQLQSATFTLTGKTTAGSVRHFTWKASGKQGMAASGSDTMGLADGKIAYHYTSFRLN